MTLPLPVLQPAYSALIGRPLDNTALATYMTCPKKYEYSMIRHRRKSGPQKPALAYGSCWHTGLETSYKHPECPVDQLVSDVHAAMDKAWEETDRPDDYRTLDRCKMEYERYLEQYGLPWTEEAKTVGWPHQPLVEISTELTWPGALHPYAGKIDRVILHQGLYYVEDHKTSSRKEQNYFRQFELKNQMIGYAFMAQLITGKPIAGVRINAHFVRTRDSENERSIVTFSQSRLKDWAANYNEWVQRIERDIERAARGEPAFPHNFDACDAKYGMCQYAAVCSEGPAVRDRVLEQEFAVKPWNPLEVEDGRE